jgi:ParB-like chromosome segregation protein Spo0J
MTKYQLLPPLASDDMDRLTQSIKERGVKMPVVFDEQGEILDGHNRVMIADSLGIEYPRIIETGLDEHEKRIFVAELNVARRQMTDAQKVALGKKIEPDIAERARLRMLATQKNDAGEQVRSYGHVSIADGGTTTRDEVAQAVQLGSGRTYERGKQVLDELANEPDGEQLLQHINDGSWDLDDVRTELRHRRRQEAQAEQAESDRLISLAGDPEGKIAKARLLNQFSSIRSAVYDRLIPLDPEAVVAALDEPNTEFTRTFIRDCRQWLTALESEMQQGIRLVHRKDAS